MEERKKAQDVFNETNFVFATKTTFEKAFPEIKNINVEIEETGTGTYNNRTSHYSKEYISEYVNCSNPKCYNGGFRLGCIIREMVYKKETEREGSEMCQGSEGSPKGRKIYRKCWNDFSYKIQIEYLENAKLTDEKEDKISEL
jgi:hypothetical protein